MFGEMLMLLNQFICDIFICIAH